MTVRQIVTNFERISFQETTQARVSDLLEKFGLFYFAETAANDLSEKEKFKLSLLIACIGKPEIVLVNMTDSASSQIDQEEKGKLWEAFTELTAGSQSAIIVATNSLDQAMTYSDRFAVLDQGYFNFVGSGAQLREAADGENYLVTFKVDLTIIMDEYEELCKRVKEEKESQPAEFKMEGNTKVFHIYKRFWDRENPDKSYTNLDVLLSDFDSARH